MLEQRFALEYRQTPTDQPGLVMRDDGIIQRVKPDGTRELVPGSGGGGGSGIVMQQDYVNHAGISPANWTDLLGPFTFDLEVGTNYMLYVASTTNVQNTDPVNTQFYSQATFLGGDPNNDEYEDEEDKGILAGDTLPVVTYILAAPRQFTAFPLPGGPGIVLHVMCKVGDPTVVVNTSRGVAVAIPIP